MGNPACVAGGETVVLQRASLSTRPGVVSTNKCPQTNDARRKAAEYDAAPRHEGEVHEASVVCFEVGSSRRVVWRSSYCWGAGSASRPAECHRQTEGPGAALDRPRGDRRAN